MQTITIAFTPEGPTDERFLSSIITRTIEDILTEHGRGEFTVLPPMSFSRVKGSLNGAEKLLEVARRVKGYHFLIIHADADDSNSNNAMNERIKPGADLIRSDSSSCQDLVPLVPVHMSESWMFADPDMLRELLNTQLDLTSDLGLPRPSHAERPANPKELLANAIRISQSNTGRRKRTQLRISDLYAQFSEIDLNKLNIIPSYQIFRNELIKTLRSLNFI